MPNVYIKTFGCQMNEYDSQKMLDVLSKDMGYQSTNQIETANLVILNTCSVREKAEKKVYDELGKLRIAKKNNEMLIGVAGCVASQEGEKMIKRIPEVDLVFGPQTIHRLPQLINQRLTSQKSQIDISFPAIEKFDNLPISKPNEVCAFVSIIEGCSKYCSFCIVPYTRGNEVSRPKDAIIEECKQLIASGVKEITLLGQNVNGWNLRGKNFQKNNQDRLLFADLLEEVHSIKGLLRLRYTTTHPMDFNQQLIDAHKNLPKLATHIHLPVQSGSDKILHAMKRRYTSLEYLSIIRNLRKINPQLSITSDFIVGFPGETEADFQKTLDLILKADLDQSFSFIYSKRPGTPAADFVDNIDIKEKKERLQRLQNLLNSQSAKFSRQMVGRIEDVLIEGKSKKHPNQIMGRTSNNRVVNIRAKLGKNLDLIGNIIKVKITEALPHSLRGEIIRQ